MCRRSPSISHLFFADDCLIFCGANLGECQAVKRVIQNYEAASGQRLKREKSRILFSHNTSTTVQAELQQFWNATVTTSQEKYLGLPTMIGRGKKQAFVALKEKVGKRIRGWHDKLLSYAGK